MPQLLPPRAAAAAPGARKAGAPGGTLFSSTANLANTLIGSGALATPGAFRHTGLVPGAALICWCAATSAAGLLLLVACARTAGGRQQSFGSLAQRAIPRAARLFNLAIALKCYGVSISYLIINGQLMPQVVLSFAKLAGHAAEELPHWTLDRDVWILVFMVLLVPFCFLRRLDSLRHTSYLSLIAVLYLVLIVVLYSLPSHKATLPPPGDVYWFNIDGHHFVGIFPVFVFAFTCAQNCLPVYNELAAPHDKHFARMKTAVYGAIGAAACVYLLVGVLGYASFGSAVGSNIIAMYPNDLVVCFARIAIVILVAFSYPLQVHPCRAAIDKVFTRTPSPESLAAQDAAHQHERLLPGDGDEPEAEDEEDEMAIGRWCLITGAILASTFTISLLIDDLGLVLGFVGSVGSTTISFILPGILYSVLHRDERGNRFLRPAQLLAVYGVVVLALCLSANIVKLVQAGTPDARADRIAALVEGRRR